MNAKELPGLVFSIVALVISVSSLILSYIYYRRNYKKITAIKRYDHVLEVNKLLLADSDLFTLYDDYQLTDVNKNSERLVAKREAFFDYLLVTFENVYYDFKLKKGEEWTAWDNSIDEFFKRSSLFRQHVQDLPTMRPVFTESYMKYLHEKLKGYKSILRK